MNSLLYLYPILFQVFEVKRNSPKLNSVFSKNVTQVVTA